MLSVQKGFVKLKKAKNPRKTRKWVGGQSPTRIRFVFPEILFFCVFFVFLAYIIKKMDSGVWVVSGQYEFFLVFGLFFNLTIPLSIIAEKQLNAYNMHYHP